MGILNFGSINIDHVYAVERFVRPGETLHSRRYAQFPGGKGFNQSVALARAGASVRHAGRIGKDGVWLREYLGRCGADTSLIEVVDGPTGHAIIQVADSGENAILLHAGANHRITAADAERALARFTAGDFLLLQNEISAVPEIMERAAARKMRVVFNPAPMTPAVAGYPLDTVSLFVVNEVEGGDLTGEKEPARILAALVDRFEGAAVVLTLGADGALYGDRRDTLRAPAVRVQAVDTTAAGDTFIGYLLADLAAGRDIRAALTMACRAAAVCVTRPGAADSIPLRTEV
jgi:ribokinase